jgi:Tol biopolymer transport system component
MPAIGGTVTRVLTAVGNASNLDPIWSPDGTRFAYVHVGDSARSGSLWMASTDGTSRTRFCGIGDDIGAARPDWQPR